MLAIRFQRVGKKHQPVYRIVLAEKTRQPQGKAIEILGNYNPILKIIQINKEKILYWLSVGAQPTAVVHNLLVRQGVINQSKIRVHKRKLSQKEEKNEGDGKSEEKKVEMKNEGENKKPESEQEEVKENVENEGEKKNDEKKAEKENSSESKDVNKEEGNS